MNGYPSFYPRIALIAPSPGRLIKQLTHWGRDEMDISQTAFRRISFNENIWICIEISLKLVPKGPSNNIPALIQIIAWRRPGGKPLSEPMMVILLAHICDNRPQWVNKTEACDYQQLKKNDKHLHKMFVSLRYTLKTGLKDIKYLTFAVIQTTFKYILNLISWIFKMFEKTATVF